MPLSGKLINTDIERMLAAFFIYNLLAIFKYMQVTVTTLIFVSH